MCDVCWRTPCHPRCPNAPEPRVVGVCDNCGFEIREGDEYIKLGIGNICEACVEDGRTTAEDLL